MKNKKISTRVGMLVILIISTTVSVFVWKYESGVKQLQEPNRDLKLQTTNQKKEASIYKNSSYNYEIGLLPDYYTKTGSKKDPDSLINIISEKDNTPLFSIHVEKTKFTNINSWLTNYQQNLSKITSYEGIKINTPSIASKEEIIVDNIEAIKLKINNMPYSDSLVAMIKNGLIYTISYNGLLLTNEKDSIKEQPDQEIARSGFQLRHRKELDKMISLFKIVE